MGFEADRIPQVTAADIEARIDSMRITDPAPDSVEFIGLAQLQYWHSCGVRGDNTPENAQYLGYLLTNDLYPDIEWVTLEAYAREVLEGRGRRVYEHLMDLPSLGAANKA